MCADLHSIFVLGSSHREAPLAVREQFALEPGTVEDLQKEMRRLPGMAEALILNTCNRLEIYGVSGTPDIDQHLAALLCQRRGIDPSLFAAHTFVRRNFDAIQHILEVASGIDSQMVGETEILGQMKSAYERARLDGTSGPILGRLLQRGFHAAKAARSQSQITTGQISIGNVAVELAERIFGRLNHSQVLLLGSGEVAEKTAQALQSRGAPSITVSSRTYDKARQLAHAFGGSAIDFEDFTKQLFNFDIIIGSTRAPGHILNRETIQAALKRRPGSPMFFIDLAVPRDIDPSVEKLENVYRYDLDDLSNIANENLESRRAEIEDVRRQLTRAAWNIWLQLHRRF